MGSLLPQAAGWVSPMGLPRSFCFALAVSSLFMSWAAPPSARALSFEGLTAIFTNGFNFRFHVFLFFLVACVLVCVLKKCACSAVNRRALAGGVWGVLPGAGILTIRGRSTLPHIDGFHPAIATSQRL